MRAAVLVWVGAAVLALNPVAFTPAGGSSFDAGQGATSQMRRGLVRQLAAGKLLVAARGLPDPNFSATVVLLADFDRNGAMGLILNRQTDVPLARLFPGLLAPRVREMNAFFGGPVPAEGVLALVRSNRAHTDIPRVVGDVYLVNTREVLDEVIAGGVRPDDLRVFVGYAGWGPGQLDSETAQGAWHLLDGSGAVVFDPDPDTLWERQMRRTEALSVKFTSDPLVGLAAMSVVRDDAAALLTNLTDNAAPDLIDTSPDGQRLFVASRGPVPLSGDPHNAVDSTPGMGIIEIAEGGRGGSLVSTVPMVNPNLQRKQAPDPHGLRVRLRR